MKKAIRKIEELTFVLTIWLIVLSLGSFLILIVKYHNEGKTVENKEIMVWKKKYGNEVSGIVFGVYPCTSCTSVEVSNGSGSWLICRHTHCVYYNETKNNIEFIVYSKKYHGLIGVVKQTGHSVITTGCCYFLEDVYTNTERCEIATDTICMCPVIQINGHAWIFRKDFLHLDSEHWAVKDSTNTDNLFRCAYNICFQIR